MPRRPTEDGGSVPLWLIPAAVLDWIRRFGEDLEWVRIRRSARHLYEISVRIRSVKREFGRRAADTIAAREPGTDLKRRPAAGPGAGAG